jgi:glycosyltransferase involved in cell wall biosynthesis
MIYQEAHRRIYGDREGIPMQRIGESSLPDSTRSSPPLVSIITVTFNALASLPDLLESIFPLKGDDVEVIVVDGGSKDGTVLCLQQHEADIDRWLSEPDRGIYDAMNKAIALARGTWLLHLNAGDRLLSIPRKELEQAEREGIDIVAFRVSLDGKREFRSTFGKLLRYTNTLHHQGAFYRRSSFPGYNIAFHIFADFDANQRLALAGAKTISFDQVVAYHATDGVSNQNNPAAAAEFFSVVRSNYGRSALPISWAICKWQGLKRRCGLGV